MEALFGIIVFFVLFKYVCDKVDEFQGKMATLNDNRHSRKAAESKKPEPEMTPWEIERQWDDLFNG